MVEIALTTTVVYQYYVFGANGLTPRLSYEWRIHPLHNLMDGYVIHQRNLVDTLWWAMLYLQVAKWRPGTIGCCKYQELTVCLPGSITMLPIRCTSLLRETMGVIYSHGYHIYGILPAAQHPDRSRLVDRSRLTNCPWLKSFSTDWRRSCGNSCQALASHCWSIGDGRRGVLLFVDRVCADTWKTARDG